jgi:hypothetical protein
MPAAPNATSPTPPGQPRRMRLPGFVPDEPVGLGDVVKRVTTRVGVPPCGGCAERARRLNNWLVFTNRRD